MKIIADIGSNHNQDEIRCVELIRCAKAIGCDAVKFQLFDEDLYAPEFTKQREQLRAWKLPLDFLDMIRGVCDNQDIEFHCSPFSLPAVEILDRYVDALKIGGYEILRYDLIKACVDTCKPISISLTNATTGNIENLLNLFNINDWTIYTGSPHYPAKPEGIGEMMRRWRGGIKGYSDHTVELGAIFAAVQHGAKAIEFHLDLKDGQGVESQIGHCWSEDAAAQMIDDIRVWKLAIRSNPPNQTETLKWRTDPEDGMRPMRAYREELLNDQ